MASKVNAPKPRFSPAFGAVLKHLFWAGVLLFAAYMLCMAIVAPDYTVNVTKCANINWRFPQPEA